ncbi:hypothetical protein [Chryseobacterium shandongense]|uniref:hypothetical protein n=1 Tax=Chryseobacterium shandongense TaxID=1493872 RepID=UPI000F4F617C|nr:hypothetical protein [Chryseobacterium shandongense]AZA57045.1 hypothetical protein EG350_07575 [Chryseobacterium shandongense]
MKRNLYLIIITFSLVSCYTYQVKKQPDPMAENQEGPKNNGKQPNMPSQNMNGQQLAVAAPIPVNVQEKLTPGKNVKIDIDGKKYKVIVDKWERDSLVAHPVHNAKKTLKFHKNQINVEKIAEKRFSQPIADIITVVAYAGIGVAIYSLLQ